MNRRRRSLVVIALILGGIAISLVAGYSYSQNVAWAGDEVHVVYLQGQMATATVPGGLGVVSSETISGHIRDSADSGAAAIVLRVNSPGGTPAAAQEVVDAVEYARSKEVPVVASMGDIGASAAYYAASETDRIVANPDTMTGSIGVIWLFENSSAKFRKEGTNYTIVKSGEFKDMGYPQVGLTEEEEEYAQGVVDAAHSRFVEQVAEGRNLPRDEVESVSDGRVYTGRDALELGLVDEMGTLDAAIEAAEELSGVEDAEVRYVNRPSLVKLLLGEGGGVGFAEVLGYLEPYGKLLSVAG
ncbi:MAG: hypothetical protein MAG715_00634 [Methanonatronarchaeales archaeon]|nr:hypothetical protein [Methanonatronarchaeales archaeon]